MGRIYFQNYNLIGDETVFDNVALVLRMMGIRDKEEIQRRVMFILKRVGIDRYRNRPAKMLSGGERQRVGIARALVKTRRSSSPTSRRAIWTAEIPSRS